ncbi:MAG: hypothetical protein M3Q95_08095, partial [Bacteroidota bacterium]|nr:hypothetical protein [Bacteroidota bacterium]
IAKKKSIQKEKMTFLKSILPSEKTNAIIALISIISTVIAYCGYMLKNSQDFTLIDNIFGIVGWMIFFMPCIWIALIIIIVIFKTIGQLGSRL